VIAWLSDRGTLRAEVVGRASRPALYPNPMHRLPLVLCALAVLGSTLSAVLYFRIGNSKQALELRLTDAVARAAKLDGDLAAVNEQNGTLKAKATGLESDVAATKAKLNATEERLSEVDRKLANSTKEIADVKSVLSVYEATTRALGEEVAALREDLEESRSSNASPEAVLAYKTTIAELERQLATAKNGAAVTGAAGASTAVFASRAGRATVLTVGPDSAFVVLNFGVSRGAKLGQKLTVSQGSSEVATVLISDVRANFSVAQVIPDTLRGILQKGDSAVLLR
jgi:septal ring factor EnvC (AmiA/AmiB activator)